MTVNAVKHAAKTTRNMSVMMWRHLHCQAFNIGKDVAASRCGSVCASQKARLVADAKQNNASHPQLAWEAA